MSFYYYLPFVATGIVYGAMFLAFGYICKQQLRHGLLSVMIVVEGGLALGPYSAKDCGLPPELRNDFDLVGSLYIAMLAAAMLVVIVFPRLLDWSWRESNE
jgi:hypothetical protein